MLENATAQGNLSSRPSKFRQALTFKHPKAVGIDTGSASHFVAVPPDWDHEPVHEFSSFTAHLNELTDWLAPCSVDAVAMKSTGVHRIPLYELMDRRRFVVHLLNARHIKNLSGRKSDLLDCQ